MTTTIDGFGGAGTSVAGGAQGSNFTEIGLQMQLVADAWSDPSDTPTRDVVRMQRDATPRVGLFAYNSATGWVAVVLS